MPDRLLRALEDELEHLRQLREAVLQVLANSGLSREDKLSAIEHVFEAERNEDEEREEARDRERLSWGVQGPTSAAVSSGGSLSWVHASGRRTRACSRRAGRARHSGVATARRLRAVAGYRMDRLEGSLDSVAATLERLAAGQSELQRRLPLPPPSSEATRPPHTAGT